MDLKEIRQIIDLMKRNDLSLFPGESTTITARYRRSDLGGAVPGLALHGYNVPEQTHSVG